MNDDDSDVEFYSFILVNEDLQGVDENKQKEKEVPISESIKNNNEDQFFQKLSIAFYSENINNSDNNIRNIKQIKGNHAYNQSEKIVYLESQNTQPHTPKYIISRKSQDDTHMKDQQHYLLKNYKIKTIQKQQIPQEINDKYDMMIDSIKENDQILDNNTMKISETKKININQTNSERQYTNNNGGQKKIYIKQKGNIQQIEQNSLEKKYQNFLNQTDDQQTQKAFEVFDQQDSAKNKKNIHKQKEIEPFKNQRQSLTQRGVIENNQKFQNDSKTEDSIQLNHSLENNSQLEGTKLKMKKQLFLPEKKYNFMNHFTESKNNLTQSSLIADSKKKLLTSENISNKKMDQHDYSMFPMKTQTTQRKSVLQSTRDLEQSHQINNINNIAQKDDFNSKDRNAQNANFFKISQKNKDHETNKFEEKVMISGGRKIKKDNQLSIKPNSNDQICSAQSINSPSVNKFTPSLKKLDSLQSPDQGFTTPIPSLINYSSFNSGRNGSSINQNNFKLSDSLILKEESKISSGSKTDLNPQKNYNFSQKFNFQTSSSTKNSNQNTIQLINSLDQSQKLLINKTIKEQQLMSVSAVSPKNQATSQKMVPLINNPQTLKKEDPSLEYKNSFLAQAFKTKIQQNDNKYLLKNGLIKMPLNASTKAAEIPFISIQNSNNQSQKVIQSPKNISSTILSPTKQKLFISIKKKVESNYSNDSQDEKGFSSKFQQQ